jgi:hypothetical protein
VCGWNPGYFGYIGLHFVLGWFAWKGSMEYMSECIFARSVIVIDEGYVGVHVFAFCMKNKNFVLLTFTASWLPKTI